MRNLRYGAHYDAVLSFIDEIVLPYGGILNT